jgi:acetylcholinesterase
MRNILVSTLVLSGLVNAQQNDNAPTATIANGVLRGRTTQLPDTDTQVNQFFGIPFAQPPIDDLRFSPPREAQAWNGVLDATERQSACMQYFGQEGPGRDRNVLLFRVPTEAPMSEDCLHLDIYVPQGGEANKSVLFWIHGGSGLIGASSWPDYDGTYFAANQDVIVVAANYRLNGMQAVFVVGRSY